MQRRSFEHNLIRILIFSSVQFSSDEL